MAFRKTEVRIKTIKIIEENCSLRIYGVYDDDQELEVPGSPIYLRPFSGDTITVDIVRKKKVND